MNERRLSRLFRPYVLPADDEQTAPMPMAIDSTTGFNPLTDDSGAAARRSTRPDDRRLIEYLASRQSSVPYPDATRPSTTSWVVSPAPELFAIESGADRDNRTSLLFGRRLNGAVRRNGVIVVLGALCVASILAVMVNELAVNDRSDNPLTAERTTDSYVWFGPSAGGIPPSGSTVPIPTIGPPVRPVADHTTPPVASRPDQTASAPQSGRPGVPPVKPGPPKPTGPVPSTPQNATAYSTIQAERFDGEAGIQTESNRFDGGQHIGFISSGDWVRYDNIGFTNVAANSMLLSTANGAVQNRTGWVELRLDRRSNAPIASMRIVNNGDWFAFNTYRLRIPPITGVHTLYLTFTSDQDQEFGNLDWFSFRH